MIASLHGRVAALEPAGAVVEVGGVGLVVQCTPTTLAGLRVGEDAWLATSLVVREDALTLYGFGSADERTVFELLLTASGVGPRLAQAMLAVHTPTALRRAVAAEDLSALTQVPGIGKKGAQRIVFELRDRLGVPAADEHPATASSSTAASSWRVPLKDALTSLGWSTREADDAVAAVAPQAAVAEADGGTPDVGTLLRTALRTLDRA